MILTAVGVGGLFYWLLKRSGDGPGFGLGIGGLGGSKLFEQGGGGPSAEDGTSLEEGDGEGTSPKGNENGGGKKPGEDKGGDKPSDGSGQGQGPKKDGDGGTQGGDGGGLGGGEGGGVGQGEGEGDSDGQEGEGGDEGDDEGGGESDGKYDPWGGLLIQVDLPAPDMSDAKLTQIAATIEDLVTYAVLETDLPPPLHAFDPNLGGLLQFWADVTLHIHYELPPGRLDPDNASHVPYINLWIDILAKLAIEEQKINADIDEDDDGVETENSAASSPYGLGQLSAVAAVFDFRISRRALARARRDPIKRFALGELWQT
ncbi:MAG: hypothetical protein KC636_40220 [Myxococcales bacterium]|nr:hypothetical protein [Myxococcales bacterium]